MLLSRQKKLYILEIKCYNKYMKKGIFSELRFAIDNGRTLCVPCHKTTDTYLVRARHYGGKSKNGV